MLVFNFFLLITSFTCSLVSTTYLTTTSLSGSRTSAPESKAGLTSRSCRHKVVAFVVVVVVVVLA